LEEAMHKLALTFAVLAAFPVLAAESTGAVWQRPENPMARIVPPRVTREAQDKKEITALWKSMEDAQKKGDVNAAADLVDYPVLMITDDSKGEAMGETWTREKWIKVMEPFYANPSPDMKATHKTNIFLLSDSLASVGDVCTLTMGGKTMTLRNASMVVRKNGKWLIKAMAEGGWGDMMASGPATAGQLGAGQQGATGTGSTSETPPPSTTK
jgi:ketosteroid isomerase-like protein